MNLSIKAIALATSLFSFTAMAQEFKSMEEGFTFVNGIQHSIESLNKDLSCKKDSDCISIALGKRACGGPSGYITASKRNKYLKAINLLAQETTILESRINQDFQVFSICSIEMPDKVACEASVCKNVSSQ
jgi:hypothetical protein